MSQEPESLVPQIDRLVRKASTLDIDPSRIRAYAQLLVAAELEAKWQEVGDEHARRASHEEWGELHGLDDGYWNLERAERVYRRGRKARQAVHASSGSARIAVARLEKVFKASHADLPAHIQIEFPQEKINQVLRCVENLWRWTHLPIANRQAKDESNRLTLNTLVYLWWRHSVANYRGKWVDMHALAQQWWLTDAKLESFRRCVLKSSAGITEIPAAPPWVDRNNDTSPSRLLRSLGLLDRSVLRARRER
jgi:hypothetical protein